MPEPWERQPNESPKAFGRFCAYLEMRPQRSLTELARRQKVTLSAIKQLSSRWRWRDRAAAWERELGHAQLETAAKQSDEARQRQLRDAITLQQLARAQLAKWIERSEDGGTTLRKQLKPAEVIQLWEMGFLSEQELRAEMSEAKEKEAPSGPQPPPQALPQQGEKGKCKVEEVQDPREAMIELLLGLCRGGVPMEDMQETQERLATWLGVPHILDGPPRVEIIYDQDQW